MLMVVWCGYFINYNTTLRLHWVSLGWFTLSCNSAMVALNYKNQNLPGVVVVVVVGVV